MKWYLNPVNNRYMKSLLTMLFAVKRLELEQKREIGTLGISRVKIYPGSTNRLLCHSYTGKSLHSYF